MKIKKLVARSTLNSRKEPTIEISIETDKGNFISSAPSGKSKGRFEANPYFRNLEGDINSINKLDIKKINKIKLERFNDLKEIEGLIGKHIGANSLFSFEASILKAMAAEQEKELWEFLSRGKAKKFPDPVGNAIGGGLHSHDKRPDFQEFLFISKSKNFFDRVFINRQAYKMAGAILKANSISDEGAWYTPLDNEGILKIMNEVKNKIKKNFNEEIEIGTDIAASTFFTGRNYNYKNNQQRLNRGRQVNYIAKLITEYGLSYIEDPLEQEDFYGFYEIKKKSGQMIVGDDLTVTNLMRLKKALQKKSINAIIVKPNQNGSLLRVKEICDFCKKNGIKTILSHRSGETLDSTIADLAVAWKADFIKTGIFGKEREAKLKRLIEIEERS